MWSGAAALGLLLRRRGCRRTCSQSGCWFAVWCRRLHTRAHSSHYQCKRSASSQAGRRLMEDHGSHRQPGMGDEARAQPSCSPLSTHAKRERSVCATPAMHDTCTTACIPLCMPRSLRRARACCHVCSFTRTCRLSTPPPPAPPGLLLPPTSHEVPSARHVCSPRCQCAPTAGHDAAKQVASACDKTGSQTGSQ